MPNKANLTNAEIEILTMRLLYPSIYGNRMSCLESMMTSSNFYWKNGEIAYYHADKNYKKMKRLVFSGKAPSIPDRLWEHQLEAAKKTIAESVSAREESPESIAKNYVLLHNEREEVPRCFMLTSFYSPRVVNSIPDNVKPDFLDICVEYLEAAVSAKTDFNEKTILTKSELRSHFGESGNGLNEKELEVRKLLSEEITKILYESEGKTWPPTQKDLEKDRKEWEERYSPAARAKTANAYNLSARKCADEILQELNKRNLI